MLTGKPDNPKEELTSRGRLSVWIESRPVQTLIIVLIVVNAAILGMETSPALMSVLGPGIILVDRIILGIFVVEIALKLIASRWSFFRDPWSVFDFVVVAIALIPSSGPLAVLRVLRVFRVLRLISVIPRLRFVVEALLRAVPGIMSIAALMLILFYVFSVMATGLYGIQFPQWFGSIGASMFTLFQIMTLESWSMGVVRPVMAEYPYAWVFFVPFILLATFTMLNLFIGIIVDTMQIMHENERAQEGDREDGEERDLDAVHAEVARLRSEIHDLRLVIESQHRNLP